MLPRGIRNHNPLNIRRNGKDQWKGLAEHQQDAALTSGRLSSGSADSKQVSVCTRYDAEFCQFKSLEYGWRAAFYLLTRTYYHKYRLYTIRGIISKWAPPTENKNILPTCLPSLASCRMNPSASHRINPRGG